MFIKKIYFSRFIFLKRRLFFNCPNLKICCLESEDEDLDIEYEPEDGSDPVETANVPVIWNYKGYSSVSKLNESNNHHKKIVNDDDLPF